MAWEKATYFEKGKLQVHAGLYEGIPVLFTIGEADADNADVLQQAFDYAVENDTKQLIVDIRTMDYIDSTGYHVLIYGRKKLEEIGGTMVVVDLNPPIDRVVILLGLDSLMTVVHTLNQAVEHIRRYPLQPPA